MFNILRIYLEILFLFNLLLCLYKYIFVYNYYVYEL